MIEILSIAYTKATECTVNVCIGDSYKMTYQKARDKLVKELEKAGYNENTGKYHFSDVLINIDMVNELTTATFKTEGYDFLECVQRGFIFDLRHLNQLKQDLQAELDKMPSKEQIEAYRSIGTYSDKSARQYLEQRNKLERQLKELDDKVLRNGKSPT